MILTPGHASLPSGHSTENHMVAWVLWQVYYAAYVANSDALWGVQLIRLAARIAINRTIAGLHFPVDSAVGQMLGLSLAEYFVNLCTNGTNYDYWVFDGGNYPCNFDFDGRDQFDTTTMTRNSPNPGTPQPYVTNQGSQSASASPPLVWLWNKAVAEWV